MSYTIIHGGKEVRDRWDCSSRTHSTSQPVHPPLAALPRRRCATKCSQVSCANAPTGISLSSFLLFTHSPQPISATKTKIKGKLTMPRFPNASGSSEESCSTKKSCQPLFLSCYKQRTPLQAFTEKRSQEVTRLELATSAANGITPNT